MRLIRLDEVMHLTGLKRSSIYRMKGEKRFPESVSIDIRTVGWVESEVKAWIESRIAERDFGQNAAGLVLVK